MNRLPDFVENNGLNNVTSISGLRMQRLTTHVDERGNLTELFRQEWTTAPVPVQWNFVHSEANVLRGVHVHVRHFDQLVFAFCPALIGLIDLRDSSETFMHSGLIEASATDKLLLTIPPGVAHGFYFPDGGVFFYGLSDYWDPVSDEFGCRWNDPKLSLPWPTQDPLLSARDRTAGSLDELLDDLQRAKAGAW